MICIIKAEFLKLKRLHILLIGMIGMTFPTILSIFTQNVIIPEKQIKNFDFITLYNHTVWNNTTMFMPVIFTLMGGYLINREYKDDTLKNLFTIPISFRRLIYGKLIAMGIISILLGYYSYFITLIISFITGLTVPVSTVLLRGFEQMTVISLSTYISVLPIIVFTSRKRDAFLGGVVVSFLFGYFSMFVKNATLRSMYPILSGLTIIRFDTKLYMNTSGSGSFAISLFTMAVVLLLTGRLILTSYSGNAHL
jgi:ABC-2 type transport system permease protein/bacitracin transport system permease protein